MTVRVRIAPSPTGNLHIGTTRTALFNYLFAKKHGGQFILRVEDTDKARSQQSYTDNILSGLQQLGLHWDEGPGVEGPHGPYFQSERSDIYRQYLQQLLDQGLIYPCFCNPEELQAERAAAEASGQTYVYSGKWRDANPAEVQELLDAQTPHTFRLKVPAKEVVFNDLIRGEIRFDTRTIGDMIVARQGLEPLYNFAVVVDDITMQISHVLRGEDHISNTPKQILIYEALGATPPIFGHTAMMLAPDRSKLSKRHGATAVGAYLEMGYLPEALVNYLALLGWSPPEGQEILSLDELVAAFSLESVSKSGAVFDVEKLKWVNGQWLRRLSAEDLWQRLQPVLQTAGIPTDSHSQDWWLQSLALVQEKMNLLPDYLKEADFLFAAPDLSAEAVGKAFGMASAQPVLQALHSSLQDMPWEADALHTAFEALKQNQPFKMKEIMWPIRAALTGRTAGADLQQSILLLGREACLARLQQALNTLAQTAAT
ncbi:MAG: glutamate--tRNA ligase [Candidatus Sericytochromatia bacterium]|nr:glutamate--tRNA ligase [Candidatus Sericytochromatia bacterium]